MNHEKMCFFGQPFWGLDFEPLAHLGENGMHSRHIITTHMLKLYIYIYNYTTLYINVYIDMVVDIFPEMGYAKPMVGLTLLAILGDFWSSLF